MLHIPSPYVIRDSLRSWIGRARGLVSCLALGWTLIAVGPLAASAVLISTGDGTGNTTPPTADPGFANIGNLSGLSGVYVRNGWVLTANHVGMHSIVLGSVTYQPIAGSQVRFQNSDSSLSDVLAFKLAERPPLPDLLITNDPPTVNTLITLIGRGRNRGDTTTWMGRDGWTWGTGAAIRWGTNRIGATDRLTLNTQSFWIYFDDLPGQPGGQHEADLVTGDSGGGAFVGSGASAELVGILIARGTYDGQPASTSLYGNAGIIADLYAYRNDILAVIDQPDCDDGLDEDGDGLIDYPDDPGCTSPTDDGERDPRLICDDGLDNDNDGLIDESDPGCQDPSDTSERGAMYECDNGLDDDGDLLIDYPDDDGCLYPTNLIEAPEPTLVPSLVAGLLALAALGRPRRSVMLTKRRGSRALGDLRHLPDGPA